MLAWCEDLDLADVRVSAGMLVLKDGNLHKHGLYKPILAVEFETIPPNRLIEFVRLHLLQLLVAVGYSDRDLRRRVALVCFRVQVNCNLLDLHLLEELDVDEVWLLAV